MKNIFLFLGTGASVGVPMIGCHCAVCASSDEKNRRLRASGLLTVGGKKILIDCGPDFRQQALKYSIEHLDALLITHTHYDHVAGIDELRAYHYQKKRPLRCFLSRESYEEIKKCSGYLWPHLEYECLDHEGTFSLDGITIGYVSYTQRKMQVTGFRVGSFAYISDIREFDPKIFSQLKGVETLAVTAIDVRPSTAHFSVGEATHFARKVGAKRTWLTHIAHHLDHEQLNRLLPPDIRMGYDGLAIEI
jgi:phosphoribosyl 1,2-cyclic phosphate phosphodiesterase